LEQSSKCFGPIDTSKVFNEVLNGKDNSCKTFWLTRNRWTGRSWLLALIPISIFVDISAAHSEHQAAGATIWAPYTTPRCHFNNASLCHLSNDDLLAIWKIDNEW
jgi:hypothetical protein